MNLKRQNETNFQNAFFGIELLYSMYFKELKYSLCIQQPFFESVHSLGSIVVGLPQVSGGAQCIEQVTEIMQI